MPDPFAEGGPVPASAWPIQANGAALACDSGARQCIHQLFEAQVEATPDAPAVFCEDQQLTYRELNARANQLAHLLRARGVGPEVLVGICLDRSLEMLVGVLGILKAGGAYVPLDPTYPRERLAFVMADAQIPVLLTQEALLTALPEYAGMDCRDQPGGSQVILLEPGCDILDQQRTDNLTSGVAGQNLAYVIYTSGSTGKPKGVQVIHGAVVNFLHAMRACLDMAAQDRLLAVTTLSFDIAVLELCLPLVSGACLEIVSRQVARSGSALADRLAHFGATMMQATPATWRLLLQAGWAGSERLKILCGGEALPRALANQLLDRGAELWNLYGPTEATVWCTVHRVGPGEGPVPIGRPLANVSIYLLDAQLQLVPAGTPGELYIGGVALARGYLHRPELTAEKFIANPFGKPGERLYKTGDLARSLPDGTIEFLGRLDHQVKVRGFRIELQEIEAVLEQHPAVRESVVVAREDEAGNKRLVAYVVLRPEQACSPRQLRDFVKHQLPQHMVPAAFAILDSLPLTPNGKVDRQALPAPAPGIAEGPAEGVGPRTDLELELTHIWEDVLHTHGIDPSENFFDLGGDSLQAVELIVRIQKRFGQVIPLNTLFQEATIASLAALLQQQSEAPAWSPLVGIQTHGRKPPFFCIHPMMGSVLCYVPLAHHLGREQPFYGLQALGVDGSHPPRTRIEDMATAYVQAIRAIQPEGPYCLGGWSFGGLIAFEMACQLKEQNQEVGLLALIDTGLLYGFAVLLDLLPDRNRFSMVEMRQLGDPAQHAYFAERAVATQLLPPGLEPSQTQHFFAVFLANIEAMFAYRPRTYPGPVTLFRPSELSFGRGRDPLREVRKWAPAGVAVYTVPANHMTMVLEPHVQHLAQQLKGLLERVAYHPGAVSGKQAA